MCKCVGVRGGWGSNPGWENPDLHVLYRKWYRKHMGFTKQKSLSLLKWVLVKLSIKANGWVPGSISDWWLVPSSAISILLQYFSRMIPRKLPLLFCTLYLLNSTYLLWMLPSYKLLCYVHLQYSIYTVYAVYGTRKAVRYLIAQRTNCSVLYTYSYGTW